MRLFGPRRDRPEAALRRRVAEWAREAGGLASDDAVSVSEIVCPDPACPGLETVILVARRGARTRAHKIAGPLAGVSRADVVQALAAPA